MRKTAAALAVASIALLGTTTASTTAAPKATSAPVAQASGLTSSEREYIATMTALDSAYFNEPMTDAQYIAGGRGFCENELPAGLTWASLKTTLETNGIADFYPYFRVSIRAAAESFCPQYLPIRQG